MMEFDVTAATDWTAALAVAAVLDVLAWKHMNSEYKHI